MKHFLVCIFFVAWYSSHSQNWRTVQISDTTYFRLDTMLSTMGPSTGTLRVLWVDSTKFVGGTEVSYFYKTLRVANQYQRAGYIDTSGSSWLGEKNIRMQNGDEYYINFLGDSILFKPNAQLNESWVVARDTSGIDFWGNIFSLDTLSIEGILDSIKIIQIQAKIAGIPIMHEFNNRNFIVSKQHGFVKVQQLISYPYFFDWQDVSNEIFFYGLGIYSRLPTYVSNLPLGHIDLSWKYRAGNAFQKTQTYKNAKGTYIDTTVTTDYIINYVSYTNDSGHAFILRQSEYARWVYGTLDTVFSKSQKLIDTVVNHPNTNNTIRKTVWPEAKVFSMEDYLSQNPKKINYYIGIRVGAYCDDKKVIINKEISIQPEIGKDSIGYFYYPINYLNFSTYLYLEDFYSSVQTGGVGPNASTIADLYTAYRLGDCQFGKPLDFPRGTDRNEYPYISPIPVRDELQISNIEDEYEYKIYTIQGQTILYGIGTFYTTIKVSQLPRGVYFICIGAKVLKFVKE